MFHQGVSWEHVTCVQPLCGISIGSAGVWAVGRKGESYWRMGITLSNPLGKLNFKNTYLLFIFNLILYLFFGPIILIKLLLLPFFVLKKIH